MKILVLAGGFDQIALIMELKKYGHEVILADYFRNPPARSYADKHYRVSTLDEEAVYQLALEEQAGLVATACTDQALMTVARVSERLGLPCYLSGKTASLVTNKAYMKKVFYENQIPSARFMVISPLDDWQRLVREMEYPLVVKPCDCNSSKGVVKVYSNEEIAKVVADAFKLSRSKQIIIEEFVEGREISIDVWVEGRKAKVLAVSETSKMKTQEEQFTIYQSSYPVLGIEQLQNKAQEAADRIAEAFRLKDCPMLIQAIVNGDYISVVEFSARMGGGTKYRLIEYVSGIDIMQIYVKRILGEENQKIETASFGKFVELDYVYAFNGIVGSLKNFEQLKREKVIEDYFQYKKEGSVIEKHSTSSDRIAGFLLVDESKKLLSEKRRYALERLDILDDKNCSIMYKDCFS